jgi:hypothetical protein
MVKKATFSPARPRRIFHPPALSLQDSLFTLGRAWSQARQQRVKGRGGTDRTSCGPFAHSMGFGERKSPSSDSDIREVLFYTWRV